MKISKGQKPLRSYTPGAKSNALQPPKQQHSCHNSKLLRSLANLSHIGTRESNFCHLKKTEKIRLRFSCLVEKKYSKCVKFHLYYYENIPFRHKPQLEQM